MIYLNATDNKCKKKTIKMFSVFLTLCVLMSALFGAFADDAAGLLCVHVETNGNAVVEMPFDAKVKSVTLLKDGTPLKFAAKNGVLSVTIPEIPTDIDYVIVVEKK